MGDQVTVSNQSELAITSVVDGLPRGVRLPAVAQTVWSVFGMDSFVRFCLKRYPDERMLAFRVLGLGDVVSVIDPQLIREVFGGDSEVLRGGELNAQVFGVLGPNSLLLLDGERHLRTRRLLLGPFHGQEIERHVELIERVTVEEVERWPLEREFALWPRMRAITMEVILRTVIGVRDEPRCRELSELLPAFVRAGPFGMLAETRMPWLTRGTIGHRLPWVRERAQAERLLYEEIADHRADPHGREDVLAMLISARDEDGHELSDEALRDHLLTLLGAGHDTTAAALAWCFERVLHHPDVLARCRRASIETDDEYLTAVVNEALRVRPVADAAARKLSVPFELGGHRLPAGTIVAASIRGVQHSPKVYPDPTRFSPERFLGERPAPYTLIPFGGGDRRCIGASFAMMEIKTVLGTVLRQIELRPANARDERASRTRSAATVPAHGTRVIATMPRMHGPAQD